MLESHIKNAVSSLKLKTMLLKQGRMILKVVRQGEGKLLRTTLPKNCFENAGGNTSYLRCDNADNADGAQLTNVTETPLK